MRISRTMIAAFVERYQDDPAAVEAMRDAAMAEMTAGGRIVTASSGAGTGYTMQVSGTPEEMVEFFQVVLDEIRGTDSREEPRQVGVIFPGMAC